MIAGLSEDGFVDEQIGGVTRLFALRALAERIETDWPSVAADLDMMRRQLVTRAGVVANLTADEATLAGFRPELDSLVGTLPEAPPAPAPAWQWTAGPRAEGFSIPAKVNYVSKGGNFGALGFKSTGATLVAQNLLSTTWLWDKVRLQGGAYGGFCRFDRLSNSFIYSSYRDPNLLETLGVYDATAAHLRQVSLTEQDLTRAIIGTIGGIDGYLLPDLKGLTALQRHLTGDSDSARQTMREEVLATSVEDLHQVADALAALADEGRISILGSEETLAAANTARGGNWLNITKVL